MFFLAEHRMKFSTTTPQHEVLKHSSPLTMAIGESQRKGEHRGCGDILRSLQSMQKLNVSGTRNRQHFLSIVVQTLDAPTSDYKFT